MEDNEILIKRLNRIAGQINGISNMIDQNRDCLDILNQLLASRNALSKVAAKILTAKSCQMSVGKEKKEFEQLINQFINLV